MDLTPKTPMPEAMTPLAEDDLRRWRACVRRYWLHRRAAAPLAHVPAQPGADRMVDGPGAAELRAEGYVDLHDVPLHRLTVARHRRAARAVKHGEPVLDPGAAASLHTLHGPRRWLRFETIGFAVPPWAGTQPYQSLPFQWSCDLEAADGPVLHTGFLAGPEGDPRRAFAASLVEALGSEGPVFAYNAGFERNRIRELAQRFDDLGPALQALLPRIVDLFALLRDHYTTRRWRAPGRYARCSRPWRPKRAHTISS